MFSTKNVIKKVSLIGVYFVLFLLILQVTYTADIQSNKEINESDKDIPREITSDRYDSLAKNDVSSKVSNQNITSTKTSNLTLLYSTIFGGSGIDKGEAGTIALGSDNTIVIGGSVNSTDIEMLDGYDSTHNGEEDVFLAKYLSTGDLVWSTYYGGSSVDFVNGIAIDSQDNIFITGYTWSENLPIPFGDTYKGREDAFVVKFNRDGALLWGTYIGGSGDERGEAIAVTSNDEVYVTGSTTSDNFPITDDAYNSTYSGNKDAFLLRLSNNGDLEWSSYFGGIKEDVSLSMAIDTDDNIIIGGYTYSNETFPTIWGTESSMEGNIDGFVSVFSPEGNLSWSNYFGGGGLEFIYDIASDSQNGIIITGLTSSDNIEELDEFDSTYGDQNDSFILKYYSDITMGYRVLWGSYLGGNGTDISQDVAIDDEDNIIVIGYTNSTDFPLNYSYDSLTGKNDTFLTKFSSQGDLLFSTLIGGTGDDYGRGLLVDKQNTILITGDTTSNDFPVTLGTSFFQNSEVFLSRFTQLSQGYIIQSWNGNGWGLTTDNSGRIYVADNDNDKIQVYETDGTLSFEWGDTGTGNGNFNNPTGIAISPSNYVYVTDTNNDRIQIFDLNGIYQDSIGANGSGAGNFFRPLGVHINSSGHIFVADMGNDRVQIFSSDGVYQDEFGQPGKGVGQFSEIYDLTTDESGLIYVADFDNDRIEVFYPNGTFTEKEWGSSGDAISQFDNPVQIEVDSRGWLYVSDLGNKRIQVFTGNGDFVTLLDGISRESLDNFGSVAGMHVNSSNYLFMTDLDNEKINIFRPLNISDDVILGIELEKELTATNIWGSYGDNNGQFKSDFLNLAYNPVNNRMYVLDSYYGTNKIQIFELDGTYVDSILENYGMGITINSSGYIFETDFGNHIVEIFNSTNHFVDSFGGPGSGNGTLNGPWGIAINNSGYIYITDFYNHRVQIFNSTYDYVSQFGSSGIGDGQFTYPETIAINASGFVFVSEYESYGGNRIQIFDANGNHIKTWSQPGSSAGSFNYPSGIAFDDDKLIYVTDTLNHRVQVYNPDLTFNSTFGSLGSDENQFNYPTRLAFDNDERIYVIDQYNYRIQTFELLISRDIKLAQPYLTLTDHTGGVLTTDFSSDGKNVASAGIDNTIILYYAESGLANRTITGHNGPIFSLSFSPDNSLLASGSTDNSVRFWNPNTGDELVRLSGCPNCHSGPVYAMQFSADGTKFMTAGVDGAIKIWNTTSLLYSSSPSPLVSIDNAHTGAIMSVMFSRDSSLIISSGWDESVKVWHATNGSLYAKFTGHTNIVSAVDFSPDSSQIASASWDGTIKIWDIASKSNIATIISGGKLHSLDFAPDGTAVAVGASDGSITVWELKSGLLIMKLNGHTDKVNSLNYSPDQTFMLSGSSDGSSRVWNLPSDPSGDVDRDGMLDIWESLHNLNPFDFTDKFLDTDDDGIINVIEHLIGSNPLSNDTDSDTMPDGFEISKGLNLLLNDGDRDLDNDQIANLYEFNNGLLIGDKDSSEDLDGDGISNLEEFLFGSLAYSKDTDADGLPDDIEYYNGLNPVVDDSADDRDLDGLPNIWEYHTGLNMSNPLDNTTDFDKDGIPNYWEYRHNLMANNSLDATSDPDNDNLTNLEEYKLDTDPFDPLSPPPVIVSSNTTTTTNSTSPIIDPTLVNAVIVAGVLGGGILGGGILIRRRMKEEF
ncbi:MAG: SBBP repeat-containing protein [Candidatus Hodarchaeales archaeon]